MPLIKNSRAPLLFPKTIWVPWTDLFQPHTDLTFYRPFFLSDIENKRHPLMFIAPTHRANIQICVLYVV